jgi:hypothetical protein
VNISSCAARVAAFGNLGTLRDNMVVYSKLNLVFSVPYNGFTNEAKAEKKILVEQLFKKNNIS